jgi:hypothetical protein
MLTVRCKFTAIDLDTGAIPDQTYLVDPADNANSKSVNLPTYKSTPAGCTPDLTFKLIWKEMPAAGTFPSFINEVPTTKVTIATTDPKFSGEYTFELKATDTGGKFHTSTFKVTVSCKITAIALNVLGVTDTVYTIDSATSTP